MPHAQAYPSKGKAENPNKTGDSGHHVAVDNLSITCKHPERKIAMRISGELLDRASSCAAAVDEPLTRWLSLAVIPKNIGRHAAGNRLHGISVPASLTGVPRSASTVVRLHLRDGSPSDTASIRQAIAEAVLYCARRTPVYRNTLMPHVPAPMIGRDYLIETNE